MRHENVLKIEGVAPELFEFCMVSRWMENGNMLEYLRTKEQVDRVGLVSLPVSWWHLNNSQGFIADVQLIGITRGLQHLHFNHLIHGDLKGVSNAFGYLHHCRKS